MLAEIKHNLFYFYKLSIRTVLTFWVIYLGFVLLFMLLTIFTGGEIEFLGVNSMPVFIFMGIYGFLFLKESFPRVIRLGVTRKSYVFSALLFSVLLSIVMTILSNLSLVSINLISETLQIDGFVFAGMAQSLELDNIIISTISLLVYEGLLYLLIFLSFTLVAAVLFRFGLKLGGLLLIIIPASLFIKPVAKLAQDLIVYIAIFHENYFAPAFIAPYLVISLLFLLTVRKSSVVD